MYVFIQKLIFENGKKYYCNVLFFFRESTQIQEQQAATSVQTKEDAKRDPTLKSKADRDRYLKEKSANNIKKFTEERKSLAVKQDKRREKLKNQHQAQISDLDKYVQNVSIIIVIFELNSCFDLFFSFSVYGNVQK